MDNQDRYVLALSMHERARTMLNGLIAAHFEMPLSPFARMHVKKTTEEHAQRWGEPILLVTGDIEQLYFPIGKKPEGQVAQDSLSGAGYWGLPISTSLERILSDDEVRRAALITPKGIEQVPLLVLQVAHNADATKVAKRFLDLQGRNIPLLLDPEAKDKMVTIGRLSAGVTEVSAAQDLALG